MSDVKKKRQIINYVFFNDLRRYWVIGILLLAQLFIFMPFRIILYATNDFLHGNINWEYFFSFRTLDGFNAITLALISILIATAIFSEIQKQNDNVHLHSLPLNKKQIFINKVLAGILIIFTSVFINFVITYILALRIDRLLIPINYVYKYYLVALIVSIIFFMQGVFFSIVTSNIPLQLFSSLSINAVPLFIEEAGNRLLSSILVGRMYSNANIGYKHLFPLANIIWEKIINIGIYDILLYLICILAIFSVSFILYIKRKNEKVNQTIAYEFLKPIFKYLTTFLTMLLFTTFVSGDNSNNLYEIIVCSFIGSFIGYYIAQMIIVKEINVMNYLKGFYMYVACMLIFVTLLLNTNIFYLNTPPKLEDVKRAYVTIDSDKFNKLERNQLDLPIKNQDTINKVILLHQHMIEQSKENQYGPFLSIVYELKNGKKVKRLYTRMSRKNEISKYLSEIAKDEDYKKVEFDILKINYNHIEDILIVYGDKPIEIKDKEKIKYITENIKNDIKNNILNFDFESELTLHVTIDSKYVKNYSRDINNRWLTYELSKNNKWIYELLK